jgi:hypothetical protein
VIEAKAPGIREKPDGISKECPGGRSDQTKLTACRKDGRVYRQGRLKSRRKSLENSGSCAALHREMAGSKQDMIMLAFRRKVGLSPPRRRPGPGANDESSCSLRY